jgi:hypothetical protein
MSRKRLPQVTITLWVAVALFYSLYGFWGDINSLYPVFVFVYQTIIPVTLIVLPVVGVLWLLWFTGKETNNVTLFFVAFWMLICNGLAFGTILTLPPSGFRHHGHWLINESHFYLGSQWFPGEGRGGAVYSAYECNWIIMRCKEVLRQGFSMDSREFEGIKASITVLNNTPQIVISSMDNYEFRP